MKPITKTSFLIVCLFNLAFQYSFSQKKKKNKIKRHHTISINHQGSSTDLSSGFWGLDEDDYGTLIYLSSKKSKKFVFKKDAFFITFYPTQEELSQISNSSNFSINRPAGTINFNSNTNEFNFIVNDDFKSFLSRENITGDSSYDFMKLFLGEIDKQYVMGLKTLGYTPSMRQLGKMGILDVSLSYINDIIKYYEDLDLEMITKFSIHGVSQDYLEGLKVAGYGNIDPNMVKKFAIHGIEVNYIEELSNLGYKNVDPNMIKKLAIHGVSTDYIEGLNELGYSNLDLNTIRSFAIHGVSIDYIDSLLKLKIDRPSTKDIKSAKIHGVSARFVQKANNAGHNSQNLKDYVKLKIHGI